MCCVSLPLQAKCPVCDGFGALPDQRHMCVACNGTGYHKHTSHLHGLTHYDVTTPTHTHAADTGDYDTVESDSIITQLSHHNCRACGGYGVIPDVPCPTCGVCTHFTPCCYGISL